MKTLLILRHAKSSWSDPSRTDHERPLNKRGKRDAPRMGTLLREQALAPHLILSSTAKRACRTAKAVAENADYRGEIRLLPDLYHGDPEVYRDVLRSIPDNYETVMVVGHNPGLEAWLEMLTGRSERLPTAALAHVQLSIDSWQKLDLAAEATLVYVWRPRELT
jgi:phosphohistidine phosphatase